MVTFFIGLGCLLAGCVIGALFAWRVLEASYVALLAENLPQRTFGFKTPMEVQGEIHIKSPEVYKTWIKGQKALARDFPELFGYCVPRKKNHFQGVDVPDKMPEGDVE